eukprot:TRINITY_DN16378_c0_g1_i1.p1 TRINITY_DN16378_c0_g1~~TRINITY_DN16378_c0_g1_i1.p1  ORF type:complete len:240 (-),score=59.59 TRINITY_DN16378_c0_g1_i1:33-707(-)
MGNEGRHLHVKELEVELRSKSGLSLEEHLEAPICRLQSLEMLFARYFDLRSADYPQHEILTSALANLRIVSCIISKEIIITRLNLTELQECPEVTLLFKGEVYITNPKRPTMKSFLKSLVKNPSEEVVAIALFDRALVTYSGKSFKNGRCHPFKEFESAVIAVMDSFDEKDLNQDPPNFAFCFSVSRKGKVSKFTFHTKTRLERDDWILRINSAIEAFGKQILL